MNENTLENANLRRFFPYRDFLYPFYQRMKMMISSLSYQPQSLAN